MLSSHVLSQATFYLLPSMAGRSTYSLTNSLAYTYLPTNLANERFLGLMVALTIVRGVIYYVAQIGDFLFGL